MSDDPDMDAIGDAGHEAQVYARKAIVEFMNDRARAHPDGSGTLSAAGMMIGFLMSVVEAGLVGMPKTSRKTFVGLAGSVFDDVKKNRTKAKANV